MGQRKHHRKLDEETTYWLSYSDMMAGLLLCFVLIISFTLLQSRVQFDLDEAKLIGKEKELIIQSDALEKERQTIASQQKLLDEQTLTMSQQQKTLEEQQEELIRQETAIKMQSEEIAKQQKMMEELRKTLADQQIKLDNIIGVRGELIEDLKDEFNKSNMNIKVDEQTGAITFDSSILYEYGKDELRDSGKDFLGEFIPRYLRILLGPKYRQYVAEVIIEGHTDNTGNYLYNLDLSQRRALSVADYILDEDNEVIDKNQIEELEDILTVTGKSFSDPILKSNGEIDPDASRRVEFLFRLKDEEMIQEMMDILSEEMDSSQE